MRAAILLVLVACADAPVPIDDVACPDGGTQLTYDSFGRRFMADYCDRCHSGDEGHRHGAPTSFRFDTLDDIRVHAARIFVRSAATNTTMPPGPDDPDLVSRDQLAEWLACGAP